MKPPSKPKQVKSAEDLATRMVEEIRRYTRNCRCPRCHKECIECEECNWCQENLKRLLLASMVEAPFFVLQPEADRDNIALMKTKSASPKAASRKSRLAPKLTKKSKTKALKKLATTSGRAPTPKLHKKAAAGVTARAHSLAPRKPPVSIRTGRPKGGDSDRGLYVRFDSPEMKAKVKAAAKAQTPPESMNAYIVAAALDWVEQGKKMPAPQPADVAAAG